MTALFTLWPWPARNGRGSDYDVQPAATITAAAAQPPPVPFFRELVRRVLYSREFVKTYNLVLAAVLVLLCARHVARVLVLRRRRRRQDCTGQAAEHPPWNAGTFENLQASGSLSTCTSSPSSSSSPQGGDFPKLQDELKPLLLLDRRPATRWRRQQHDKARLYAERVRNMVRGLVVYQPTPLWGRYESPPIGIILVLCVFYALNLFYALYQIPFHHLKLFVLADRLGSVFVINLPLLYLLAAKSPVLKALTGLSYEQVNVAHRAVGRVCLGAALGHFGVFVWVWWATLKPFVGLGGFLANPAIAFGLVAWSAYMLLGATSKEEFRTTCGFYETFLFLHVVLQAVALGFLFFHHRNARPYVLAASGIWLCDRLLYRICIASIRMDAALNVLPDGNTVRVTFTQHGQAHQQQEAKSRMLLLLPSANKTPSPDYHWRAGEHVFISLPSIAISHPHPFSIASPPGESLQLLIRARDGFSRRVLEAAVAGSVRGEGGGAEGEAEEGGEGGEGRRRRRQLLTAIVEGPYSGAHARNCLASADVAVCIAGGSGIAVIYPLVHSLLVGAAAPLPPAGRRTGDVEQHVTQPPRRVIFIWVIREQQHIAWLPGTEGQLDGLRAAGVDVAIHVTDAGGRGDAGRSRPDLKRGVADILTQVHRPATSGVVVCGPAGMVRDVRNACAEQLLAGRNVTVVAERFGW